MSLEQWESYHRSGAISSCPISPDGGYDQEVRLAWEEFFSGLQQDARVLDIGTGNGAIARIAVETAARLGRRWQVHGTDLARIDPVHDVPDGARRLAGITFHPGVATEHLPFESASFDAVSGQYALEYTEPVAAFAELFRVLKPNRDLQFIVHSADSVLAEKARQSLQEADIVLSQTRIFRCVHRLVTIAQYDPAETQRAAEKLRSGIRVLKQALANARGTGSGHVLSVALDAVQKLLKARTQAEPQFVGQEADRAEQELRTSIRRLKDLLDHARNPTQMDALQAQAANSGFTVIERLRQYHAGHNLVGWLLLMHRP